MKIENIAQINWHKVNNLIPAIIQHVETLEVLMLGYMDKEALEKTLSIGNIVFYSREKQRLWMKGETSGNYLTLKHIILDCDHDSLLIQVMPAGPTCHLQTNSCFNADKNLGFGFIAELEKIINERKINLLAGSYTANLFKQGIKRIAQKVGEEGLEVALAALSNDNQELLNEGADLIFHLLVLLQAKQLDFIQLITILQQRSK